jgi:two-component system NtrC family response regulator
MARVLIIDDDVLIQRSFSRCLGGLGHEILLAGSLREGIELAGTGVDIVYLDLNLPDGDGIKSVDLLADTQGRPEIIVITGAGDNYGAEETMASGAWDYLPKPANPKILRASLESALGYHRERRAVPPAGAAETAGASFTAEDIIGASPAIERARRLLARAAESEAGALLLGETGVGKELAARAIHANSRRQGGAFIVVDCSNLTESLIESALYGHVKGAFTGAHTDRRGLVAAADGGTLFLDEVGELPLGLQKSFLRVLQERRFRPVGASREQPSDFRLIAATNRDLEAMARNGTFRSDLLYRVRTLEIRLPPLRERGEDVGRLAVHFARQSCARYGLPDKKLSRQAAAVLAGYSWPGNVREIGNVMEAAVIEADRDAVLHPKHLPGYVRVSVLDKGKARREPPPAAPLLPPQRDKAVPASLSYGSYKEACDRAYFQQLMEMCDNDILQASLVSGLSVASVYRHLGLAGIPTSRKGKG